MPQSGEAKDSQEWQNSNRLYRDQITSMRLEGIYPSVLKEMANMIVRLWFLSMKNGGPYPGDLWELEKKLAS